MTKTTASAHENPATAAQPAALASELVTLAVASTAAEELLLSFDYTRTQDDRQAAMPEFWRVVEHVSCRLRTNDVNDDAKPMVLAVDAVVSSCFHWRSLKSQRPDSDHHDAPAVGSLPVDDPRIQQYEAELRRELSGQQPDRIKSLGQLVEQVINGEISSDQLTQIVGLRGGAHSARLIGLMIDAAFSRAGVNSRRQPLAVRLSGAIDLQDAWTMREELVQTGHIGAMVRYLG